MMAGEGGESVSGGRGPAGMAEGGPAAGASQRRDEAVDARPRVWVEVEQRLFWRVDVTDWIEDGDDTPEALLNLARAKLDYHEYQVGEETESVGYGWAP